MEIQATLIGVNSFSFPDKATGALIEGCRVRCLTPVPDERLSQASGHEQIEFRSRYSIASDLLKVSRHILGDEWARDVILIGEMVKQGKNMLFEVRGMRAIQ